MTFNASVIGIVYRQLCPLFSHNTAPMTIDGLISASFAQVRWRKTGGRRDQNPSMILQLRRRLERWILRRHETYAIATTCHYQLHPTAVQTETLYPRWQVLNQHAENTSPNCMETSNTELPSRLQVPDEIFTLGRRIRDERSLDETSSSCDGERSDP